MTPLELSHKKGLKHTLRSQNNSGNFNLSELKKNESSFGFKKLKESSFAEGIIKEIPKLKFLSQITKTLPSKSNKAGGYSSDLLDNYINSTSSSFKTRPQVTSNLYSNIQARKFFNQ